MKESYILALDQGTTSSRAILFNRQGHMVAMSQKELPQFYPRPGWVEQHAAEIFSTQMEAAREVLEKARIDKIQLAAIGISNQRETTVVWEKDTGMPVSPALVWQDKRTVHQIERIKNEGMGSVISEKTGLVADTYFSASKISWILQQDESLKRKAAEGKLLFGNVDAWLIWNLTEGEVHATDFSNASRTLLYNIADLEWDTDMLEVFEIPSALLPEVRPSSSVFGKVSARFPFLSGVPIAGVAGDQQSALFGQACFEPGMVKNTYGTGCFLLMNTGSQRVRSSSGLLTTIAWGLNGSLNYALEGSVFIAGAAIQWLRDGLGLIKNAGESEGYAQEAGKEDDLYFVPAFSGLGAPYWDMQARGGILGITHATDFRTIVRATLESLAYQSRDVIVAMEKDGGKEMEQLRVDGGASVNNYLMQFQADILGKRVHRPENIEATALGAAMLAGLGSGEWNWSQIEQFHSKENVFVPEMSLSLMERKYKGWLKAVDRVKKWSETEEL